MEAKEIKLLAEYNLRVRQGIVHTKEYKARMKELQEKHTIWVKEGMDHTR